MVYGGQGQDDLLGRVDGVAVAVVVDVLVLLLQGQAGSGVLGHVAEVGLLHRAQEQASHRSNTQVHTCIQTQTHRHRHTFTHTSILAVSINPWLISDLP